MPNKTKRKRAPKASKASNSTETQFVRSTTPVSRNSPEREVQPKKARSQIDRTREYDAGPTSSKYPKQTQKPASQELQANVMVPAAMQAIDQMLTNEEWIAAVRLACEKKRAQKPVVRGDTEASESEASTLSSSSAESSSESEEGEEPEPDTLGNKPAFSTKILRESEAKLVFKNPEHRANRGIVYSKRDFESSMAIAHKHLRISDADLAKSNLEAGYKFLLDAVVVFMDKTMTEEELEEKYSSFREYGPKNTPIRQLTKGQIKEYSSVWYHSVSESPTGNTPGYVAKATRDLIVFAGCRNNLDAVTTSIHQKLRKLGGKKYRVLETQGYKQVWRTNTLRVFVQNQV